MFFFYFLVGPCANMSHNCSYGCDNEAGVARCFCEKGKQIAADGYSCEGIYMCFNWKKILFPREKNFSWYM